MDLRELTDKQLEIMHQATLARCLYAQATEADVQNYMNVRSEMMRREEERK